MTNSFSLEQVNWLQHFIVPLEAAGFAYMVTGSVVSIAKGEPRLTLDVDFVIELNDKNSKQITQCFPEDSYYCPPIEVIQNAATSSTGNFYVIHHDSGMKADFFVSGKGPLHEWGLTN
ncbi:MAG: hypothetical protein QGF07_01740, partial [Phycisphaerales bacterium]|nr:hypothetical protein [Phycisphaerales bacterium]